MKSYLPDFNEISKALAGLDRAQALDDLNNEMAGREVGRITRFLTGDAHNNSVSGKRGRGDDTLSALQLALLTSDYADFYNDTFDGVRKAEGATERALVKAEEALENAEAALVTTLDRAATLDDGTRVFKDADGQVWTEDGQRVEPHTADAIEWRGHEPGYETFLIRKQAVTDANADMAELRDYQVTLGEFRDRLTDEDNPPSRQELDDIADRTATEMPGLARQELDAPEGTSAPRSTMANAALPTFEN